MRNYLNNSFLEQSQNANMPITKALLKYGQHNFAVLIIEFADTETVNVRETYWITKLLPYYNVLKQGYSSLGYKHTEETRELLSNLAKSRIHSDETKALISKALTGENNPFYGKTHSEESKLKISTANSAFSLYVYNSLRQLVMICPSVRALADLINTNSSTITNCIKNKSLFRGEWYFASSPFQIEESPLIIDYNSKEGQEVILEMKNSFHIRKAVFLFDAQKEFIRRYDGIMAASKDLGIGHTVIQKNIELRTSYKGYFFSYERL
jgi:group I intron endonuclease